MVTIDPERDTARILTRYVRFFVPRAHALRTTDQERLRTAADAFGATYSVVEPPDGSQPEVSHSALVYVVNPQGRVVVAWPFGTTSEDMAHDLRVLLSP
jgi:protein SCO1/2